MKFLVDESLSHRVAEELRASGHDAVHVVKDLDLGGAPDADLLVLARREARVLIAADTDFGELLAFGQNALPSVILYRREQRAPHQQADVLLQNLEQIAQLLAEGAIVVFEAARMRVRILPVQD